MNFDLNAVYTLTDPGPSSSTQTDNVSIHQTNVSGMVAASISYYLYENFSFGLKASYFYAGSAVARAIPNVLLQEQKLTFGNGDIGFTIGMHF